MPTTKKVRYVGPCERFNNKYGKLIPGRVIEIEEQDYMAFLSDHEFEPMIVTTKMKKMVAHLGETLKMVATSKRSKKKEE